METKNLTFGQAIEALKAGKKVARQGWNGKGMYLYLVSGHGVDAEFLRDEASRILPSDIEAGNHTGSFFFNPHIDMRTANGSICVGWLASQSDMLLEDWCIVE